MSQLRQPITETFTIQCFDKQGNYLSEYKYSLELTATFYETADSIGYAIDKEQWLDAFTCAVINNELECLTDEVAQILITSMHSAPQLLHIHAIQAEYSLFLNTLSP